MYFDKKWSQLSSSQIQEIKDAYGGAGNGAKQSWQEAKARAGNRAHHSAAGSSSSSSGSGSSGSSAFPGATTHAPGVSVGSQSGSAWSQLTNNEKDYWSSQGLDKASYNNKYGKGGQPAPAVPSNWNSSANVGPQPPSNHNGPKPIETGVTLTPQPAPSSGSSGTTRPTLGEMMIGADKGSASSNNPFGTKTETYSPYVSTGQPPAGWKPPGGNQNINVVVDGGSSDQAAVIASQEKMHAEMLAEQKAARESQERKASMRAAMGNLRGSQIGSILQGSTRAPEGWSGNRFSGDRRGSIDYSLGESWSRRRD